MLDAPPPGVRTPANPAPSPLQPSALTAQPRKIESSVDLVVAVSSHESATFRGGCGQFCVRVARLAARQGLLHLSSPTPFNSLSHWTCHARVLERVAKSQFVPGRCDCQKSSPPLKAVLKRSTHSFALAWCGVYACGLTL